MLENVRAVTDTAEFEDDGGFRFVSLRADGERMVMELCLVPGCGGAEQLWNIACHGVRDFRVGGFMVLELPSREEAIAWAAKACRCCQELRVFGFDPGS